MKGDSDEEHMLYEDDELTTDLHELRDPLSGWPHEMRTRVKRESWWEHFSYQITRVLRTVLP